MRTTLRDRLYRHSRLDGQRVRAIELLQASSEPDSSHPPVCQLASLNLCSYEVSCLVNSHDYPILFHSLYDLRRDANTNFQAFD
ncbi:hypothetical protein CPB85DRAFT_1280201 [Mucidula mucida]|nr:hypothetical protein CPB85DRAFT_1280201 [Mucidula mucida]